MSPIDGAADETLGKHSRSETDEGTALVRDFLDTWKARVGDDEAGVVMSEEEQVAELRRTAEEFEARFEGNAWVKGLMESF